ncbi:hypothetical protein CPSG_09589 [Coccidioides posadasii str. Silveira]|uniref:Uncharacterized protein n=1 Tax=Coccidioides posadasii (strain RMSCC 757 / Silveira) TaxID=443226 RepID=E9DIE0_COCPS|nr:hypothetical protein CPSG_09589 [Coccidioides posadasii str. Silveira]
MRRFIPQSSENLPTLYSLSRIKYKNLFTALRMGYIGSNFSRGHCAIDICLVSSNRPVGIFDFVKLSFNRSLIPEKRSCLGQTAG